MGIDAEAFMTALAGPACRRQASVDGLADLWPVLPDRLRWAMSEAGVSVDEWEALELAVRIAEALGESERGRRLFELGAGEAMIDSRLLLALADDGPGLVLDEDLAQRLPLVPLATDIALRYAFDGRLAVELVDSSRITGLWGCITPPSRRACVVLLSDDLSDVDLAETFAHELAHALDPHLTLVDSVGKELFANHLGPRLLAEGPESVTEAQQLVEATLESVRGRRWRTPASHSLEDLLEWALADVCPERTIELELIAAHPAPGPDGVNALPADLGSPCPAGEGRPEGTPCPAVPALSGSDAAGGEC